MKYLILALLPSLALANGPKDPPMSTPLEMPPVIVTTAANNQAVNTTNVGPLEQQQSASSNQTQSANNAGNEQAVSFDYPRQAPAIGQGSLAIGTCGTAANGGGSGSGGAAFLGLAWTPKDCKLLLAAQGYAALGMNDSACEMLNGIGPVRARWKELGMSPPSCKVSAPLRGAADTAIEAKQVGLVGEKPAHGGAGSSSHAEKVEEQKAQVAGKGK